MQVIDTMYSVGTLFTQKTEFYTDSIISIIEQKYDTPENILCNTSGDYSRLISSLKIDFLSYYDTGHSSITYVIN
jgi:hypothetical protein